MEEPPIIDHIPDEKRPTNTVWWVAWIGVALLWIWYLHFFEFSWVPIAIGGVTGMILASWAVDITGNKTPESWRSKPSRTGRSRIRQ